MCCNVGRRRRIGSPRRRHACLSCGPRQSPPARPRAAVAAAMGSESDRPPFLRTRPTGAADAAHFEGGRTSPHRVQRTHRTAVAPRCLRRAGGRGDGATTDGIGAGRGHAGSRAQPHARCRRRDSRASATGRTGRTGAGGGGGGGGRGCCGRVARLSARAAPPPAIWTMATSDSSLPALASGRCHRLHTPAVSALRTCIVLVRQARRITRLPSPPPPSRSSGSAWAGHRGGTGMAGCAAATPTALWVPAPHGARPGRRSSFLPSFLPSFLAPLPWLGQMGTSPWGTWGLIFFFFSHFFLFLLFSLSFLALFAARLFRRQCQCEARHPAPPSLARVGRACALAGPREWFPRRLLSAIDACLLLSTRSRSIPRSRPVYRSRPLPLAGIAPPPPSPVVSAARRCFELDGKQTATCSDLGTCPLPSG